MTAPERGPDDPGYPKHGKHEDEVELPPRRRRGTPPTIGLPAGATPPPDPLAETGSVDPHGLRAAAQKPADTPTGRFATLRGMRQGRSDGAPDDQQSRSRDEQRTGGEGPAIFGGLRASATRIGDALRPNRSGESDDANPRRRFGRGAADPAGPGATPPGNAAPGTTPSGAAGSGATPPGAAGPAATPSGAAGPGATSAGAGTTAAGSSGPGPSSLRRATDPARGGDGLRVRFTPGVRPDGTRTNPDGSARQGTEAGTRGGAAPDAARRGRVDGPSRPGAADGPSRPGAVDGPSRPGAPGSGQPGQPGQPGPGASTDARGVDDQPPHRPGPGTAAARRPSPGPAKRASDAGPGTVRLTPGSRPSGPGTTPPGAPVSPGHGDRPPGVGPAGQGGRPPGAASVSPDPGGRHSGPGPLGPAGRPPQAPSVSPGPAGRPAGAGPVAPGPGARPPGAGPAGLGPAGAPVGPGHVAPGPAGAGPGGHGPAGPGPAGAGPVGPAGPGGRPAGQRPSPRRVTAAMPPAGAPPIGPPPPMGPPVGPPGPLPGAGHRPAVPPREQAPDEPATVLGASAVPMDPPAPVDARSSLGTRPAAPRPSAASRRPRANLVDPPADRRVLVGLVVVVVVLLGILPLYLLSSSGSQNAAFGQLDALNLPSWASGHPVDHTSGDRWCVGDCLVSQRTWQSSRSVDVTADAYATALVAAGWTKAPSAACPPQVKGESLTCWQLDADQMNVLVTNAPCAVGPVPTTEPGLVDPGATVKPSSPAGCDPTSVDVKVFARIAAHATG